MHSVKSAQGAGGAPWERGRSQSNVTFDLRCISDPTVIFCSIGALKSAAIIGGDRKSKTAHQESARTATAPNSLHMACPLRCLNVYHNPAVIDPDPSEADHGRLSRRRDYSN